MNPNPYAANLGYEAHPAGTRYNRRARAPQIGDLVIEITTLRRPWDGTGFGELIAPSTIRPLDPNAPATVHWGNEDFIAVPWALPSAFGTEWPARPEQD